MMYAAHVPVPMRYVLFRKAFKTATLLDGLVISTINGKTATRYEHWGAEIPRFAKHLRTWGEAGVVTVKGVGTNKLEARGITCMFVGYALHHAGDCYRMFNPKTKGIHQTRDVQWLKRMYYDQATSKVGENDDEMITYDDEEDKTSSVAEQNNAENDGTSVGENDGASVGRSDGTSVSNNDGFTEVPY